MLGGTIAGVSNDDDVDVYVSELEGGSETGAVVSTRRIKAGDLDEASVGKLLGFHDDKTQRNVPARILPRGSCGSLRASRAAEWSPYLR